MLRAAIFVYDIGKDGKTASLIDKRMRFVNNVCTAASKLAMPYDHSACKARSGEDSLASRTNEAYDVQAEIYIENFP